MTATGLTLACTLVLAACGGQAADDRGSSPPGVADAPDARASPSKRSADVDPRGSADRGGATPRPALPRASAMSAAWPRTLQIGIVDPEDGAAALRTTAPFGVRWHYLSGGAGTPSSWDAWRTGHGSFVTAYANDSHAAGTVPFFSYYVLQETPPASEQTSEPEKVVRGLRSGTVVRRVTADLRLALERLDASTPGPSVLQVEPDLWGYVQQRYGDDARKVRVRVAAAGAVAKGLPDTLPGFARMITRLRDRVAPRVLLAYPVSVFGTDKDIKGSQPSVAELGRMVRRTVAFWRSAGRPFDLMTFEYANRDAGYQVQVDRVPDSDARWTTVDFARHLVYVRGVLEASKRPGVLWQVPPGNTVSPAMDDTPGHYTDNKVQALLGQPGHALLKSYRDAGVAMVLFGSAFPDDTCACVRKDRYARGDQPDDGGYLADQVRRYVAGGPLKLRVIPRRVGG